MCSWLRISPYSCAALLTGYLFPPQPLMTSAATGWLTIRPLSENFTVDTADQHDADGPTSQCPRH